MNKLFSPLFFILTISLTTKSQTYESRIFNNKNGLLDNEVYNVFQDSKGFLWALTERGLHVYDGKTLKIFPDKLDDVSEGRDGFIYGPGNYSIHKYNPLQKTEKIETKGVHELYYDKEKEAFRKIAKITDHDGVVYFYFPYWEQKADSITLYFNGQYKIISLHKEIAEGFNRSLITDNNKKIWVSFVNNKTEEKKLSYFENGNLIQIQAKLNFKENPISIFENKKKEIYIFCKNEIIKLSGSVTTKIKIPKEVANYFIEPSFNKCEDSKGNIWMPYERGLLKISKSDASLILDKGHRAIACDSLGESSFDEKGDETKTMIWMCDGSVFANAIGIDQEDRIYTGNKKYENGMFTEVFSTNYDLLINKIVVDKENNIWYGTARGLFKYRLLPISNITTANKIRGTLYSVDNEGTLFTNPRYKAGWTNRELILVYKYDKFSNAHTVFDSIILRDEKKYDISLFDFRFLKVITSKKATIIINEESVYTYDGNDFTKLNLDNLKLSPNKIKSTFNKKKLIDRNSIFKDSEDFVWFYYEGNYIKTDGITFWCFGKEVGINDTLSFDNISATRSASLAKSRDFLFSTNKFYFLEKNKFTKYNCQENKLPEGGRRTTIFGNTKGLYFFFDSLSSPDKKHTLVKFENSKFIPFKINNPDGIRLTIGNIASYGNDFIFDLGQDEGFVKIEINNNDKSVLFKRLNVKPENLTSYNNFIIQNNKLFLFSQYGSLRIFPLDSINFSVGEPVSLPEYSNFYSEPYVIENKIYIENSGSGGDHPDWLLKLNPKDNFFNLLEPNLNIISVSYENSEKKIDLFNNFNATEIPFYFNPLKINFKGICLTEGDKVKYKYFLEGLDKKWNEINEDNVTYSSLSPGKYTFKVLSCNNNGVWNKVPTEFSFTILPPWYRTWYAYGCYTLAFFAAIRGFIKNRTKKLEKEKHKLEKTVEERTAKVEEQKQYIEEKNKEITDSIHYAQKIQHTLLASKQLLDANLKDYFVLFQPKDIVSGDFYWATKHDKGFILITADCTGHGVPGAFMSLLSISYLNEITKEQKITQPDKVFNILRDKIITNFDSGNSEHERKDGMDAVICDFDFKNNSLQFAGANNPVWQIRNGKIIEFKPDKMPVGVAAVEHKPFTLQTIKLEKGDIIYTITDGYADQFGGPKGKKFMYKQMKELIESISHLSMQEQKTKLEESIAEWKGKTEQVDDILLIAVKIT